MSKSIKLKDNTYLDSSSIVHNKELLSDIINISKINLQFDSDYIYTNELSYICFKIGKICILNIYYIAFKSDMENYKQFILGLPKPKDNILFYLYGGLEAKGSAIRCGLNCSSGNIGKHWSDSIIYGDSANKQYSGILIYETIE